jgi:hypothetical protein
VGFDPRWDRRDHFFAVRVYDSQRGPPLARWHTYIPHELSASELDSADWKEYLLKKQRFLTPSAQR